ncbi:DUF2264 domain-containing protein [Alkalicoccus daliensis]|uniref:DUF2264 domain-containing protein n=1 Tax=Alkalicoccus daliensis TaxID=745820 RepID=A0A1H0G9V0_9BACI|nr:DUF2264 domain-containing protein [Alkalicoccus daliensis]SDO03667.1 hypothetical protein SAMN04488053_10630 [Alkalicoccus daliensis]
MKTFKLPIESNPLQTKKDLQDALLQIVQPLKPYYSEGKAHVHISNTSAAYADEIAEMETFSRVLWGIAPLLAGGAEDAHWKTCLEGIKNGTNPSHEEYWGEIHNFDQRIVEMAVYGYTLVLAPEKLWEPLAPQEKENLASWLSQINHCKVHDCNWLFFPVLVNLGLKNINQPYDAQLIEQNLDRIEHFYLQNGWYADGVNAHTDYYVPFALHFYGLFYAKAMEKEDPDRAAVYKDRAAVFAQDFIHWFSEDGSAVPYGRSMTYRFSQTAFWSALVYADVDCFSLGVLKGLILRHFRWWFKQPVFTKDGLLTIGYAYPNMIMAENYNSPGSPYWSLKSFLVLSLEDEHPFWEAEEMPLPELNEKSVQHEASMILQRDKNTNHVLAYNAGHQATNDHTHTSAKYEKFVYSSIFGFSIPRAEWKLEQGAFDSMLALSEEDNIYRVKRTSEEFRIEADKIYMKWKPWADVEVQTWILPGAASHLRIHRIHSERTLDYADGGFAIGMKNALNQGSEIEATEHEDLAFIKFPWAESGIEQVYGDGRAERVYPHSNTNLMHSRTIIPALRGKINKGTTWLVSSVYGTPGSTHTNEWINSCTVEKDTDFITVKKKDTNEIIFKNPV